MYNIIKTLDHSIFTSQNGPFISLYQPAHRGAPQSEKDIIQFKNLTKDIERHLEANHDKDAVKSILEPFYTLREDKAFWNRTADGVAVFANPEHCVVFHLNHVVEPFSSIGDNLYLIPLYYSRQLVYSYHVLTLNSDAFALFDCDHESCRKIRFDEDTPTTKEEVVGTPDVERQHTHASYGGGAMYHGHDDAKDDVEKDIKRFFKHVDAFVYDHFSKQDKQPLILYALPEHQTRFRALSQNPFLLEEGVKESDNNVDEDRAYQKAWKIMAPKVDQYIDRLTSEFQAAKARGKASDDITDIVSHIKSGRVETILIEKDRTLPGLIDMEKGTYEPHDETPPIFNDILNQIAINVKDYGGEVIIIEKERMPTDSPLAAIYRF